LTDRKALRQLWQLQASPSTKRVQGMSSTMNQNSNDSTVFESAQNITISSTTWPPLTGITRYQYANIIFICFVGVIINVMLLVALTYHKKGLSKYNAMQIELKIQN